MNTVNPALMRAAEEMCNGLRAKDRRGVYFDPTETDPSGMADCMALMLALMDYTNGGWVFAKVDKRLFKATSFDDKEVMDESFPMLLLRCVAAMIGLQMEGE